MSQRNAIIIAAAVTAFVLVMIGGVAARLTLPLANAAAPVASATLLPTDPPPAADAPVAVSPDMAVAIAQAAAPGASLSRQPELVLFQGTVAYEVALDRGTVYVDADSGRVLHNGAAPAIRPHGEEEGEEHERFEEHEFEGGEHDD